MHSEVDDSSYFVNAAHKVNGSSVPHKSVSRRCDLVQIEAKAVRPLEQKLKRGLQFVTLLKQ